MLCSRPVLRRSRRWLVACGAVALAAVGVSVSLARGPVTVTVRADATLEPRRTMTLGRDAVGGLREIRVDVGQSVRAGQVLAGIDPTEARTAFLEAVGVLASAREALRKLTAPPSPSVRADARASLRQARLTVVQAEERLAEARAKATAEAAAPPPATLEQARRALAAARARLGETRAKCALEARRLAEGVRRAARLAQAARTRLDLARKAREESLARAASAAVLSASVAQEQFVHQDEQLAVQADLERRQETFETDGESAQRAAAAEVAACVDDPPTSDCASARAARTAADEKLVVDRNGMAGVRARLSELTRLLADDGRAVASAAVATGEADAALARADAEIVRRRGEVPTAAEAARGAEREAEASRLDRKAAVREAATAVADARFALRAQEEARHADVETGLLRRLSLLREARGAVVSARLALRAEAEADAARGARPSAGEVEAARLQVASAVGARKAALQKVRATTLRAPFDGVVSAVAPTGEEAQGITVATRTGFVAAGTLGAVDAARVRAGQPATVSVGGVRIDGRVVSVAFTPAGGEGEPRYAVRVAFSSPASWLLPGMAAEIELRVTVGKRRVVTRGPAGVGGAR